MKDRTVFTAFITTVFALSISSCSKTTDETAEPAEKKIVEVVTRSSSAATIEYPLTLYAFTSNGTLKGSITANDAGDALQMQLPVGDSYRLVALAGAQGLTQVTSPRANSDIGIPENGLITSPVQMGQAIINEIFTNVTANITLSYQVAQLSIELLDIPTNATAVNVTLSSLYTNETFEGTLSGKDIVTIPLEKAENGTTWKASTIYTLPGVDNTQLVIGINIQADNSTLNYSYTHSSTFQAGTPYSLIGSYRGNFSLTGTITPTGWNTPQTISFTFGAENLNNGGNNNNENTPSEFPEALTLWNELFVAKVTPINNNTAELLLLNRLEEWTSISEADIDDIVNSYTEKNVSDWRVPTEEELIYLSTNYTSINDVISSMGKKLTGSYFCNDGANYVTMGSESAGNAGSNKFKLRLVKTVTVSIQ